MPARPKSKPKPPAPTAPTPIVPVITEGEAALDAHNVDENGRFQDEPAMREAKGEKKRRALQLERLGESLVHLKPGQLVRVTLPNDLQVAVNEARRIVAKGSFGGFRRQIQLIGKIMRTVDAEPIAKALELLALEGTIASEGFQRAERWRSRLIDEGDVAIDALCAEWPAVDRNDMRQLVRAAQREREKQLTSPQTPSSNQKKIFRVLRTTFDPVIGADDAAAAAAAAAGNDDDADD